MNGMLELIDEEGQPLDLPAANVTLFEGLAAGKNEAHPTARCYLRYQLGKEQREAFVQSTFSDVVLGLGITPQPHSPWLLLTQEDGDRVAVMFGHIVQRRGLSSETASCAITVLMNQEGALATYRVKESRAEIVEKSKMPEPAMVPMGAPMAAAPAPAKKVVKKPGRGGAPANP